MPAHSRVPRILKGENHLSDQRLHRGDFMSVETRSRVMSRIRCKDTKPERTIADLLRASGTEFKSHARDLPGRPDFVLRQHRVAIFCDGDFWHGWRFPIWRLKLSEKWEQKIATTRRRDGRNHRALRKQGWTVVRLWEHQIERDAEACIARVRDACLRSSECRDRKIHRTD